ncbi:MAG: methyl-accepting chemotaxis protein [Halapricum sp.]
MADTPDSDPSEGQVQKLLRTVVPDFVRARFSLKFALILIVMGLVIGAIGIMATHSVSGQIEENVEQDYQGLATQQANVVETWVQRNAIAVKLTSETNVLSRSGQGANIDIKDYLSRTGGNLYGMQSIYVLEQTAESSRVVVSPQVPDNESLANGDREWISMLNLNDLPVSGARVTDVHEVDGTPVTAFISPIPDTENRYLVIEYSTDMLTDALTSADGSDRFTRVVNGDATVQLSTDGQQLFESYGEGAAKQHVESAQAGPGVESNAGPNPSVLDEPYVVSYAPIQVDGATLDWAVLVHEPRSSALGYVQTLSTWGMVATFGAVLFIGLLGAVIGLTTSRDLNRLRGKVEEMEEGNLEVDVESGRIDSIGRLYHGFASMRDALKQQIEEAEQARKEAEVSRAEAMEMSNYLQEKADEYAQIMQRCASGDLTQRMDPDGENEAMDRIAGEFNEMIDELEKTTGQLKSFADEVETAGDVVQTSSESVRDASEQVADSIQKISDDAYDQKEQLQEISETMDEIADDLDTFAEDNEVDFGDSLERIEEIANMLNEVVDLSEATMAESENVAGAAEEQAAELNEVTQRAEDLSRYARPLREVLDRFETESEHEFYFPTGPGSGDEE